MSFKEGTTGLEAERTRARMREKKSQKTVNFCGGDSVWRRRKWRIMRKRRERDKEAGRKRGKEYCVVG